MVAGSEELVMVCEVCKMCWAEVGIAVTLVTCVGIEPALGCQPRESNLFAIIESGVLQVEGGSASHNLASSCVVQAVKACRTSTS